MTEWWQAVNHSHSIRNTRIITIAVAASIATPFAGYYAAKAEKYFALSNGAATKAA
jgi:hypothetical protein